MVAGGWQLLLSIIENHDQPTLSFYMTVPALQKLTCSRIVPIDTLGLTRTTQTLLLAQANC